MADKDADRSSIEIKTLLRKLHPDRGNHNDRIRGLNKFRNYVIGDNRRGTPEWYDDDIPLLFLGAAAPAHVIDSVNVNDDTLSLLYGLLLACGTPSGEHDGTLKRSARHAMQLLKWLLIDWKEKGQSSPEDLNLFSQSFLCLEAKYYDHMNLDLHLAKTKRGGDRSRGGAKEDACQVIVLILTKHKTEDGEKEQPLTLEELVRHPQSQEEFELYMGRHVLPPTQEIIRKNAQTRQAELISQERLGKLGKLKTDDPDLDQPHPGMDDSDHLDHTEGHGDDDNNREDEDDTEEDVDDEDDILASIRKRKKSREKELRKAEGRGDIGRGGIAYRWEDSQLAREQRAREKSAARAGQHDTIRDSVDAAKEAMEREEEKAKVLAKDPLGIVKDDDFDLRNVEKSQAEQMEKALHDCQEELQKAEASGNEKLIKKAAAKKECLEGFTYRLGGIEAMENATNMQHSVLPTNPKFNPTLFLTLVHRGSNYETLMGSLSRLSNKTENQVEQLQNLVRDNFPLFVRCAEGFEQFRKSSETSQMGVGVNERIDKLEAIAESGAFQAKKSFKPLLDNTSEVRQVQSAMTVLQRMAPILQVPSLMRQHIENRRYSQALKTYRRVLVVDKSCKIELLNHVKYQAEECVLEARRALEGRLAEESTSVDDLLAAIRDLGEELTDLPVERKKDAADVGQYEIGGRFINVREHPPALACLLLQAAHFSLIVTKLTEEAESTCRRCFAGESLQKVQLDLGAAKVDTTKRSTGGSGGGTGNQWKYDVLDARVLSTVRGVAIARTWLPRLIRVGKAARDDEKRRVARIGGMAAALARRTSLQQRGSIGGDNNDNQLTAFEVFISNIAPSLTKLVEHVSFCSIGSSRSGGKEITMTFGMSNTPEKLRALLRSPLPPSQSAKVGKEIADLVELLAESTAGASALRPPGGFQISPLDECKTLCDSAVVTVEKRRCMYAFDVCSRSCSNRATGNGKFDAEALLQCLQKLSEQLSRPEECANEVEKGCELVIRRCCEGLASFVRDRGDAARLTAVAECASVMADRVADIVLEAALLTPNRQEVQDVIMEDIMGLESALFDEYLEHIREDVASSVRVGWLDNMEAATDADASLHPSFPAYLSASLLAITRCRAQVEQALGDKVLRRAENVPYQHLAMTTVADGVVEGICNQVMMRGKQLKVRQADRLANELEFLKNTLKRYLGSSAKSLLDSTLNLVSSKAGRGRDHLNGPDGLAALEELERLGRIYVMCLGE